MWCEEANVMEEKVGEVEEKVDEVEEKEGVKERRWARSTRVRLPHTNIFHKYPEELAQ